MEPDTTQPDRSTRLRLVDVQIGAGRSRLHLGGGLSGVLTAGQSRSAAARWIATTVIGPRPAEADGSVDIAGRLVSVRSLPSPLLPPSAPAVLDRDLVRAHWQTACARRRDELAAAHASRRLERHRVDAALERARARVSESPEPVELPAEVVTAPPQAPAAVARVVEAPVDHARLRSRAETLIAAIDALAPGPSPDALALADAWDSHAALVQARDAADADPVVDVEEAEQRVNTSRIALAMTSIGVPADARAGLDKCHRAVVEAEAELFEARRRKRSKAVARYEAAVAAEQAALADAGVDSYASFLFTIAGGDGLVDLDARRDAEEEFAQATAALAAVQRRLDVASREEIAEREIEMQARAAQLLGHVAGSNPAAELRALRVDHADRGERVHELGEVVRAAGITSTDDIMDSAREYLASPPAEPEPASPPTPAPEVVVSEPSAETTEPIAHSDEVVGLEQQRDDQERALVELEAELVRLDSMRDADVARLEPGDLAYAFESLLDAYRAGDILAGRLPLVLDGVLDGLAPEARDAAVVVLARATDVQAIVVTDDPRVMESLGQVGGTIVRWPESGAASEAVAPQRRNAPAPQEYREDERQARRRLGA